MYTFCVKLHWPCPLWYFLERTCLGIKGSVSIHGLSFSWSHSGLNRRMDFISSVLACVFHNSLPFHLVHCCHADHVSLHTFMIKSKLFSLYCKALYARSPFLSGLFSIPHVHPIASFLSWAVIPAMFLPMAFSPLQLFIGKILATTNLLATSCTTSSTNLC